jgi:hypothetical protein
MKKYKTMKMRRIHNTGLAIALIMGIGSCEKWIDPGINIDPDAPLQTSPDVMLPGVEASLAYYIGGFDVAATPAIWMQQIQGQDRQASAINSYTYRASDPNNLWGSMYAGVMMDLDLMIRTCDAPETMSPHLGGISKVLMALALGNMTDLWDSIPYSEAFQGATDNPIYTPKKDSQQEIYAEIMSLLSEAITDLQDDATTPTYSVGADYIYGGEVNNWIRAAYHLRGRYEMHLQKVKTVDYNLVLADLFNGFSGINDDMEVYFDVSPAGYNPLYQFIDQREGYVGDNPRFTNLFESRIWANSRDPRMGYYAWDETGYWTRQYAPVDFAQYTEALFLIAEAFYMSEDELAAREVLKDAIEASLTKYGVSLSSATSWLNAIKADIDTKTGPNLLEFIMDEKYKHMFCQLESWTDWRRTGYPQLTPTLGTEIPRRYPYPQSERDYNEANTPIVQIFSRVWWDAE